MAQTLTSLLVHVVFSTKQRANLIAPEIETELYAYIGGVLRNKESVLLAANGTTNHVHLLISQSKKIALSDLMADVKRSSSLWIKQRDMRFKDFQWQSGYGAFSIGQSQVEAIKNYIARQKVKHARVTFEDELREFLRKYEIDFDERYVWD